MQYSEAGVEVTEEEIAQFIQRKKKEARDTTSHGHVYRRERNEDSIQIF